MVFRLRGWGLVVLLALAIFLPQSTAFAEPPVDEKAVKEIITITAEGAFGNHARAGTWLPLVIEVENKGEDVKGKLRVVSSNQEQYPVDYITNAVIPKNSKKQFKINLPVNDWMGSLRVELVSNDKVIAKGKVTLNFHGPEPFLIGLVNRQVEEFVVLAGLKPPFGPPSLVNIKGDRFPDKVEYLELFNAIVIDDVNLQLGAEEQKALTEWVNRGGILVLGGGSGWTKFYSNLPKALRPVEISGVKEIEYKTLNQQLNNDTTDVPKGKVKTAAIGAFEGRSLYSENGQTLVVEKILGKGKIIFLAFDPAIEPMVSWSGTRVLFQELFFAGQNANQAQNNPKFGGHPGAWNPWALTEALNTIPAMELPSLSGIAIALGIYILVVGLVAYLVLKKLDKREWTWVIVPAISIIFVVVIYVATFQERLSEVVTHQITTVEAGTNTSAKALTTTGVFAPSQTSYEIELPGQQLVKALPDTYGRPYAPGQQPQSNIIVEQNPNKTRIELKEMRSWTMRGFTTEAEVSLKGNLEGEISNKNNKWVAVIKNNTEYDFTDGLLLSSYGFKKVAALKSGQQIEVEMPALTGNFTAGPPAYAQAYNPGAMWNKPGQPPRPNQKDLLRNYVIESLINGGGYGLLPESLMFLAWSEEPVKGVIELPDKKAKSFYTTLFRTPLTLKMPKDASNIPAGFIRGTIVESQNIGWGSPGVIHMQPNSEATYQLEIPEGQFKEMTLQLLIGGGNYNNRNGLLYNWKAEKWEEIDIKQNSAKVSDYNKYLNEKRQLKFKLRNSQDGFEVFGVTVSLDSKGGDKK